MKWYGMETKQLITISLHNKLSMQLKEAGVVAKLRDLLGNGPRQRFHAARGLVYMGELDLGVCSVFSDSESGGEVDSVVLSSDEDDGHSYARYSTVRYGMVWYSVVSYGTVQVVQYGMVWYSVVSYGTVQVVQYGMVWYSVVSYGTVQVRYRWYSMVWYSVVWYGTVQVVQCGVVPYNVACCTVQCTLYVYMYICTCTM